LKKKTFKLIVTLTHRFSLPVSQNPLVVFTSNLFAIMGLRSLYIVLSKAAQDLEFLEPAVAVVLGFIGGKMIAEYFGVAISTSFSLAVVSGVLSIGVGLSLWKKGQVAGDNKLI
jgi:predicted tellurium resistance membrane protein TerC